MALDAGTTLGPYEVTGLIGQGGMGEVYQARDTKLDRDVALKVLPEAFTADPDRLARFEREAKVLASLNHPNIGTIYGLEDAEGVKALVLELIEGPTLADRIKQGPIPVDEALPIAQQIAEALEAAHEQGVIHRDLKPANVKVKDDGTVKVLDFGLAKALDTTPDGDPSQSPTLTAAATQMGVILGTAAYMAPEQARGKPVGKRADIWAFGAVLYEMLTGRKAFAGNDVSDTLAAVLKSAPDWVALPRDTPAAARRLLRRCLQKDPKLRLRDAGSAILELQEEEEAPEAERAQPQTIRWLAGTVGVLAVLLVLSIVTGVSLWRRPLAVPPNVARFTVATDTLAIAPASGDVAISPNGRQLAYFLTGEGVQSRLQVRALDNLTPTTLDVDGALFSPFFSPDNEWIAFYDALGPSLRRASLRGGPAVTICDLPGLMRGASWGSDDMIVFATADPGSGLWRVPAAGGEPEQLTTPDGELGELDHLWPEVLPGGNAVLFTITADPIQDSQIAAISLDSGEQTILVQGGSQPRFSPTGHLVYGLNGTLRAVRFDPDRLITLSDPVPVLEGVVTKANGSASFRLSQNGSLVYVPTNESTSRTLGVVDRQGQMTPVLENTTLVGMPRLSPDGNRVALVIRGVQGNQDIWIHDLQQERETRLTFSESPDWYPTWTPDGEVVTFASTRTGGLDLYWKPADGSGDAELLVTSANSKIPDSWTADGQTLVYHESGMSSGVATLNLDGDISPIIRTEFNEQAVRLSPDGRWLAYVSDQTGENRVYAQPFPEGGRIIPISSGPGTEPVWSRDGRELFYRDGSRMIAVDVTTAPDLSVGSPRLLFEGPYDTDPNSIGDANYDVSPDGRSFFMLRSSDMGRTSGLIVVEHWSEDLNRLVPTDN